MNDSVEIAAAPQTLPFEFMGKTKEYFGIWIVNILLTILTLGIYSAWAKVRTKRYFYGATYLSGTNFDYLANPIAILKGWLIAVAFFVAYSAITHFYPFTAPIFMLIFVIVTPWIIVRSMMFRLRNTAYRNLHFNFNPNYKEAIKVFILYTMLVPLTLGLIIPYLMYRQKKFIVDNSNFGQSAFSFNGEAAGFYKIYLVAFIAVIGIGVASGFMMPAILKVAGVQVPAQLAASGADPEMQMAAALSMMVFMAVGFSMYLLIFAYLQARVANLIWNNTDIDGHRFASTLKARSMAWLYITNTLGIILTVGLLIPWTKIRMARYRLDNISFVPAGDLTNFIAKKSEEAGAAGEEMGEIFDIDIGL